SEAYLRRELVCQADTIKLRYGEKPEDCRYLWAHMKTYTEITAKVFSGVCVVNCLSTPLHVAEAMLTAARAIRPNLYVMADRFTGSQLIDNLFINRLGITTLYMLDQARVLRPDLYVVAEPMISSEELQKVCVTRLGITSLIRDALGAADRQKEEGSLSWFCGEPVGAFFQPSLRPLIPATCSVFDFLPRSTLVSMACCATGSIRGYDELLPCQISAVKDDHEYTCWNSEARTCDQVNLQTGILAGKLALNRLHQKLAAEGFTQVYVEQLDEGVVAVTRHCPSRHQSVVAVLRRAMKNPETQHHKEDVSSVFIPGHIQEVVLEAVTNSNKKEDKNSNGLPECTVEIQEHIQLKDSKVVRKADMVSKDNSIYQEIMFEKFTPGCVVIFRVTPEPRCQEQLGALRHHLIQFSPQYQTGSLAEHSTPSILAEPLRMFVCLNN
ncbi:hypothetical protein FQN60_013454, partial [Etheostoma spectabile]